MWREREVTHAARGRSCGCVREFRRCQCEEERLFEALCT